ncbi:DUF4386 family protein [Devosia subaequoris]|uniref:DUF4386 family protein n=1 Tax=Devosia subaequoris TaxID=395930 RepID=UPI003B837BE4
MKSDIQRWQAASLGGLILAAIACGVLSSVPEIDASDYFEHLASIDTRIVVAAVFQATMALAYTGVVALTFPLVRSASQTAANGLPSAPNNRHHLPVHGCCRVAAVHRYRRWAADSDRRRRAC